MNEQQRRLLREANDELLASKQQERIPFSRQVRRKRPRQTGLGGLAGLPGDVGRDVADSPDDAAQAGSSAKDGPESSCSDELRERRDEEGKTDRKTMSGEVDIGAEMEKNAARLADDLRAGLLELLELHNSEELRTLCISLALDAAGSKRKNISTIMDEIAGDEEKQCRKVLQSVWDGIIIEYLRGMGKNLMKYRDNLRGAVMDHWKRNTVAMTRKIKNADKESLLPVYMQKSPWRRATPTSEQDAKVDSFLRQLHTNEEELKRREKAVRVSGSYENVVSFLSHIQKVRLHETSFRDDLLKMVQELLGERDFMLTKAETATAAAHEKEREMQRMKRMDQVDSFFRELRDVNFQQRLMESIRIQVEITQRELDIRNLHKEMDEMRYRHMVREGELAMKIEGLEDDLARTQQELADTKGTLASTRAELDDTKASLGATEKQFVKYHKDAQAFVDQSLSRTAELEAMLEVQTAMAAGASARVREYQVALAEEEKRGLEKSEECERLRMLLCDQESTQAFGNLRASTSASTRSASSAKSVKSVKSPMAKKGSGKGKRKGKGKSPERGRSPTRKSAGSKKSKSPGGKAKGKKSKSPKASKSPGNGSKQSGKKKKSKSPGGKKKAQSSISGNGEPPDIPDVTTIDIPTAKNNKARTPLLVGCTHAFQTLFIGSKCLVMSLTQICDDRMCSLLVPASASESCQRTIPAGPDELGCDADLATAAAIRPCVRPRANPSPPTARAVAKPNTNGCENASLSEPPILPLVATLLLVSARHHHEIGFAVCRFRRLT
ncbi:Uncharacterized protein SCF082_LOCUS50984 [Durusdinium trenchii]|uniref:Uncharacterized protein n=1 Tax=Durusdinium trenchii TaxID=1381693 RepID=A0ABP0SBW4_9DINO